ncbi:MAG TPA: hypothetical protein VKM93_26070 [Terriglobia bacterium]|nr:hypothetical protein [Terriglobia bacterium]
MVTKSKGGFSRVWTLTLLAALALLAEASSVSLAATGQAYLKRGEPQREGRGWVEVSECGAIVPEGGKLTLRADAGSVSVAVGDPGRVACEVRIAAYTGDRADAMRMFRGIDLDIRLTGNGAALTARDVSAHQRHSRLEVQFNFNVPRRFNVDLETRGGDIEVVALDGELRATTAGGEIRTGDIGGPVHLETAGGSIRVGNVGQRLEATTAGGNVHVGDVNGNASVETSGGEIYAGMIKGSIHAQTAGGDIVVRGVAGPAVVETAGGHIQMGDCGATVRAETAGGNIRVQGARGMVRAETAGGGISLFRLQSGVEAETAAGSILAEISASRDGFAASDLETSVGDIEVFVPVSLPVKVDAIIDQAAGHKIFSDFPLTYQGQGEDGEFPFRTVHGECTLNGGGKALKIHTTMGNIEIHKADSSALNQLRLRQEDYWKNFAARQEQQLELMIRKLQQRQEEQLRFQQKLLEQQGKQLQEIRKQQPSDDDDDD